MKSVKLYANKKDPEVTAVIVDESEKYGTVLLEYRTGENAGKTTNITSATLKRWWKVAGEVEEAEADESPEKSETPEVEEPLVTKITPTARKKTSKSVKINKQEKIDYLNILCSRYNFEPNPKNAHPDVIRLNRVEKVEGSDTTKTRRYGEIKINHTSFVLYTNRVMILDQNKFNFIVDTDSSGRAKIKFEIDDNALDYVVGQLAESEAKRNGKN